MAIYKRGETWYVRFWYTENGKQKKLERAVGRDKKIAEAVEQKLKEERALAVAAAKPWTGLQEVQAAKSGYTFNQAFNKYLSTADLKPSTKLTYSDIYKTHIQSTFGNVALTAIDKDMIVQFQNQLKLVRYGYHQRPLSNVRINNIVNLVRTVLNKAVEDKKLKESPATSVKRLREESVDIDPLTLIELKAALNGIDQFYRPIFTVLAWSGMRPNELKALRWGDIDWHRNEIHITKGIVRKLEGTTKTKKSKRVIPMHAEVRRVLEQLKMSKVVNMQQLIFTSKKGDTLSHHLDEIWKKGLQKAGVKHRPSYQLRHTWASMALEHGEDPMWVSQMLGHENPEITFKHYARYIKSDKHGKSIGAVSMKDAKLTAVE